MNLAKKSKIVTFIYFSFLQLISKSISTPNYLTSVCSNTTEFAKNSKYHTNLNTLFKTLTTNATTNPTGFDITSVATNTDDAVYGLYLCRGDQNISMCSDCVKTATTKDLPKKYCPNRKVAIIWYEECLLRYSDDPLLGEMKEAPSAVFVDSKNITGNQTTFSDTLGNAMNALATQTANSKSPGKRYATIAVKLSRLRTMYAMGQCTPDLSPADCYQCLLIAIGKLYVRMGAQVLQPSCFVHYETYRFYNGATNFFLSPPLPSPSPTPSSGTY